jgi:hypothetical protein
MNRSLLTAALLAAGLAVAPASLPAREAPPIASAARISTPDPAVQIRHLGRLFRAGDLAGLAQGLVPPATWEEIRLAYELKQLDGVDDHERAAFAEQLDRIAGMDAVDRLMAEIEPQLEKARPQAAGALLLGMGAMQVALASPDSDFTESQRAALQSALPGIQRWAGSTDFLSSHTLRQALTLLTDAVRRTGVTDLDQLKQLPLESALDRAGMVFAAAKDAVRLYGVDLDAIADSLQVEVLEVDGDSARVRATVMLFGAPVWSEHDLVLVEGRWYGKDAVRRITLRQHHHEDIDS